MLNYKSYFIVFIIFFCSYNIFAAEVFKANRRQAIIKLNGMSVQSGDVLTAGSASMRVKKVNSASSFALVDIIEGRVQKGDAISQSDDRSIASEDDIFDSNDNEDDTSYGEVEEDFIDNDNDNNNTDETEYADDNSMTKSNQDNMDGTAYAYSSSLQRRRFAVGFLGGIDFDILRLKFPNRYEGPLGELPRKNVIASGLGFNANVVLDYDFIDMLGVRIFTGWKRFSVKSQDSSKLYSQARECYDDADINENVQRDCELRVNLYGVNIQLQYYFPGGTEMIQPLVGIGGGIYFVINTSKNYAIKEVKTMGSVAGILGVNVIVSKNMYLTAQADYNFSLSSSSTAQVHFIGAKIGLMYGL